VLHLDLEPFVGSSLLFGKTLDCQPALFRDLRVVPGLLLGQALAGSPLSVQRDYHGSGSHSQRAPSRQFGRPQRRCVGKDHAAKPSPLACLKD
jgi:hypothetical protein